MDVMLGLLANAMTLSTIGCFLFNLGAHVLYNIGASKASPKLASLNIEGNESAAFFALIYAFGMILAAVKRNIVANCARTKPNV